MRADQVSRGLSVCGMLGPGLFIAAFLVEGARRPAYDPMRTFVSQLSLDGGGWVQIASFVVSGSLIGAFALGLRRTAPGGGTPRWSWPAVGLVGLGLIGAGVFVDDPWLGYPPGAPDRIDLPVSWHGWGHLACAFTAFLGLVGAPLLFARAAGQPSPGGQREGRWQRYCVVSAVLFPLLYLTALASADAILLPGGYGGLLQRAALVTALTWVGFAAARQFSAASQDMIMPIRRA